MNRLSGLLLVVVATTMPSGCRTSDKNWQEVRDLLLDIQKKDLQYRSKMDSIGRVHGWRSKEIDILWAQQQKLDSANFTAIDDLITQYGYPTREHVGDLAGVPFDVIKHAGDSIMASYLQIIVGAGKNGDIRMDLVAAFHDRILVVQKQPQLYGTQVWIDFKQNKATGELYDSVYLWPVRDASELDQKRLAVGLDSISKRLRHFGIDPAKGYVIRKSASPTP